MDIYNSIECIKSNEISVNNFFLLLACELGHIELIEWLLFYDYHINLAFEDNLPFHVACENNHLELAKFIYNKTNNSNININDIIYDAFNNKNYELLKWLYEINPSLFNFLTNQELYSYFSELIYSDIEVAQWLFLSFPNIPLYMDNNYLFIECCRNNKIKEAQFIQKIKPNCYYLHVMDNKIIHYEILDILVIQNKIYNIPLTECYICYEQLSDIYTSCKHFYCKKCLETHYMRNNIQCPYCRKENNENDLSLIIYLKN